MDITSITAAFSAVKAAKDLGATLIELRDFNQVASTVTELNRKLLEAQEGIFSAQSKMLELQSEHFEVLNKLRKLEEGLQQRRRYELVELYAGNLAYRLKPPEHRQDEIAVHGDEPIHYACQPCMETKCVRAILVKKTAILGPVYFECPLCKAHVSTGEVRHMTTGIPIHRA